MFWEYRFEKFLEICKVIKRTINLKSKILNGTRIERISQIFTDFDSFATMDSNGFIGEHFLLNKTQPET
jgi:hypothetical protein